jgi:hypothetical protein
MSNELHSGKAMWIREVDDLNLVGTLLHLFTSKLPRACAAKAKAEACKVICKR